MARRQVGCDVRRRFTTGRPGRRVALSLNATALTLLTTLAPTSTAPTSTAPTSRVPSPVVPDARGGGASLAAVDATSVAARAVVLGSSDARASGPARNPSPMGPYGTSSESVTVARRWAVGVRRCTFIDTTRSVVDFATNPVSLLSNHRTLVTEIRYPIAATAHSPLESPDAVALTRRGGYPLIVFAHGYDVTPDTYAALLDRWTSAGYVVVAPFFPDEQASAVLAQHGADTEGDLANEPADLTFVTREILRAARGAGAGCGVLRGLVDPLQIALAGQSDGANAVATLAYDEGSDPQGVPYRRLGDGLDIRALLVLSGQEEPGRSYATGAHHVPLLVVQSRQDQCNSPRSAITLYRDVHQSDKWFLELRNAHHLPPYDGVDRSAFAVVARTTLLFLAASVAPAGATVDLETSVRPEPTIGRIYHGAPGPPLSGLPAFAGVCGLD